MLRGLYPTIPFSPAIRSGAGSEGPEHNQVRFRAREDGPRGGERVELDHETLGSRVNVAEAALELVGGVDGAPAPCVVGNVHDRSRSRCRPGDRRAKTPSQRLSSSVMDRTDLALS